MDPSQATWWTLCQSLLERTRDTLKVAPRFFIASMAVFYAPVIAYKIADPIADPLVATAFYSALLAVCVILGGVTGHYAVTEIHDGEKPTLSGFKDFVKPHVSALMMTSLIAFGLEFVGALLVVPGFLLLIWVTFAGPIICEEKLKGWAVIDRGRAFVEDYRWSQIVGVMFLGYAVRTAAEIVPRMVTRMTLLVTPEVPAAVAWFNLAIGWALTVVVLAALSAWVSVAYTDISGLLASLPGDYYKKPQKDRPGLKLPAELPSLSGFTPSPQIQRYLRKGIELALLSAAGLFFWYAVKPQPMFEAPPASLAISDVKVVGQKLEGHVTNNEGRTVRKAMWMVRIAPGARGPAPAIVMTNFKNGETRSFSVSLPPDSGDQPQVVPFRVEWSN